MRGFSKEQLKTIICSVTHMELKDSNPDFRIILGTYKELLKVVKSNPNVTDERKKEFIRSMSGSIAHHNPDAKIIIVFLDRILKHFKTPEKQLVVAIFSCFHEIRHVQQLNFDTCSYEKFLNDIEDLYMDIDKEDYYKNHDNYSFEIGANIYAIEKTIKYIKRIDHETFEKEKCFLLGLKSKYVYNYYTYSPIRYIESVVKRIKEEKRVPDNNTLRIFFKDDGTSKSISEILEDENYKKLDKRIGYYMFSSDAFAKSIQDRTDEELEILSKSTRYVIGILDNQDKYILKMKNK